MTNGFRKERVYELTAGCNQLEIITMSGHTCWYSINNRGNGEVNVVINVTSPRNIRAKKQAQVFVLVDELQGAALNS